MSLYNYEEEDPDIIEWGVAARAQTWEQAKNAIDEFLRAQAKGYFRQDLKIRVTKSPLFDDFPWLLRWVPKEEP